VKVVQIFLNILALTSYYVSFSLGIALVFGVTRVINFAHGEFYMLGAYVAWFVLISIEAYTGGVTAYLIAALIAMSVVSLAALATNVFIVRPLSEQPFDVYIATLSLSYIIQVSIVQIFSAQAQLFSSPVPGIASIGGAILPWQRVIVIFTATLLVGLLWLFLYKTKLGHATRAVAENRQGALLQGINLKFVGSITFMLGAAITALAGVVMAPIGGVNPFMGVDVLWKSFIIIIVGGLGSIWGAVIVSLLFGIFDTMMTVAGFGRFLAMFSALIMLVFLAVRPQGLLGEKE
jgi:branched-chain amino acid transport system permease protein/urea transport system permease protein